MSRHHHHHHHHTNRSLASDAESDELREIFDELRGELSPLGDLIAGAIGALSLADMQWAISHLDANVRQNFMQYFALPPMRHPNEVIAKQTIARIARKGEEEQCRAGHVLTKSIHLACRTIILPATNDMRLVADQLLAQFPQGLVRLYCASCWYLHDRKAALILRELVEDERLVLGAWSPFSEQAVAACQVAQGKLDELFDEEIDEETKSPTDEFDEDDVYPIVDALDEVQASALAVQSSFDAAVSAVDDISHALSAGEAPADVDLQTLQQVSESLASAAELLGLVVPPPLTLARVQEVAQTKPDRAVRALLARVSSASSVGAATRPVSEVATEAGELLGMEDWNADQITRAELLAQFSELLDAVAQDEDERVTQLHDDLLATGQLDRAVLLAAIRGRITGNPRYLSADIITSEADGSLTTDVPLGSEPSDSIDEASVNENEAAASGNELSPASLDESPLPGVSQTIVGPEAVETTVTSSDTATSSPAFVVAEPLEEAESPIEDPERRDDDEVQVEVVKLISQGRFAMAAWTLEAANLRPELVETLRVVALVKSMSSSVSPSVTELERRVSRLAGDALRGDRPAQVLAVSAAIRATLLFPQGTMTGVGVELGARVGEIPGLDEVLTAVTHAAQRGLSITAELLPSVSSVATLEQAVRDASDAAGTELASPRSSTFARARRILNEWYGPEGVITSLLAPARDNDLSLRTEVEGQVRRFGDRREVELELDRIDAKMRSGGSKRIEGQVRRVLIERVSSCVALANDWLEAVAHLEAHQPSNERWQEQPLRELRAAVHPHASRLLDSLRRLGEPDSILRATGEASATLLAEVFELLNGQALPGLDPGPAMVLNDELLKTPYVVIDPVAIVDDATPVALSVARDAAARDWRSGFEERCAHEDFVAAGLIIRRVRFDDPEIADEFVALRETRLAVARSAIADVHHPLAYEIDEARRRGFMNEDTWGVLAAAMTIADPNVREDLGRVRTELAEVTSRLERSRELESRLFAEEFASKCETVPAVAQQAEDINRMVERGDLATARDMVARAEAGEEMLLEKSIGQQIARFYPAVPVSLTAGLSDSDAGVVEAGGKLGPVDFVDQSQGEREVSARGIRAWVGVKMSSPQAATLVSLAPALRLLGIEADSQRTPSIPGAPGRRWIDLVKVRRTGLALVPAFGSSSGPDMRLMCCWGSPDVSTVLGWVAQDPSERPVVVLYFGTLSPAQRQSVARVLRDQSRRAVVVIDDAVVAYLAAYGARRFEALMFLTLPFTAVNPYEPAIAGSVPPEMFYGRHSERRSVTDPRGTSLIYGGRQLGKSALLHASERRFKEAPGHEAVYVDLDPASIGATKRPEALWDRVLDALAAYQIVPSRGAGRRNAADLVADAVRAWLRDSDDRRLLLLLDECDAFFDADAEARFVNTALLRALMEETGRRFKVVFAGLHQVQRFSAIPNQPLAHLGRPQVIGPLAPQPALDLLQRPLEGLGFELSKDLATRLMASSNYQPLALQVYGQALVERLLKNSVPEELPVRVSDADVEALLGDDGLTHQIFERFRLTLRLDPRYRVIAYTMAHQARQVGHEKPITAEELRRECQGWWTAGFAQLRPDEFRSLIEEMAGLGVLTAVPEGWRLRSPNLLRMFGTVEQIEDALIEADMETPPTGFASQTARRRLGGPSRVNSPLSEAQLAELLSDAAPPIQVVLGSAACGVAHVQAALEAAAGTVAVSRATDRRNYRLLLKSGKPGQHIVVLSAPDARGEAFDEAIEKALTAPPGDRVTRSVVLVAPATNLSWWPALVSRQDGDVSIIELRRHDARSLSAWALDVETAFQDEKTRRALLDVTGGWPCEIERAAAMADAGRTTPEILADLRHDLESSEGAMRLVESIGIANAPELVALWITIADVSGTPEQIEDLAALAEGFDNPLSAVESLRALGVLDVAPDGGLSPEVVSLRAWRLTQELPTADQTGTF